MANTKESSTRRKTRIRFRLKKEAKGKLRLTVFRSSKHIYAQIINDQQGSTVASASTVEKDMRAKLKSGADVAAAGEIGKLIAERALSGGVKEVFFDRGAYRYHGRVKALADAARKTGLSF